jgi:CheY-like chemotaxis protein
MAKTTDKTTVVLMDDELFNMRWLIDYLDHAGYSVLPARSANEALEVIRDEIYRCLILDLNVPLVGALSSGAEGLPDVYKKYPGLLVAREARNRGYRDRQVVIYSVHRDAAVAEEAEKLGCAYILKGRPKELKAELESILRFDPTDQVTQQ